MQHINKLMNLQSKHIFYYLNYNDEICIKKKPIHKISKMDFFIRNELTNISKIKKVADYKHFYYVCENSSELKITQIEDDIINTQELRTDENVLMKFDNIELTYLKNYLKTLSSPTKYVYAIIDFYKTLLKSINLLVNQKIVHNNINFQTIVVDNHCNPLLTNFTLSIDTSQSNIPQYIKHFFIEYDPSYLEWPLEFHIISYLLTNKLTGLSSNNIETIINDVLEHHFILKTFGDSIVSSYKEESILYFKKYVNQSYDYILTDILQYYYTWDNYTLSILFLRILIGIHRTIGIKNKFIILFMKLLVCNVHLNPIKRFTCDMTIKKFDSILDSVEPQDYKAVINGLTPA
jgi:hypothetical protein